MRSWSHVDLKRIIISILAIAAALVSPARAPAAEASADKTYVAFFMGQGGYLFSWGIPVLASGARELGIEADIFEYSDFYGAWRKIAAKKADGYKVGLVGYSLGTTTATYLQKHMEVDLLVAIAQSSLGRNHRIEKENTRRSVLWYGPDFLSNGGLKNGFDKVNYVDRFHLFIDVDPNVVKSVLGELKELALWEKKDSIATLPATEVVQANIGEGGLDIETTGSVHARWLPVVLPIKRDATCDRCWGFQESWRTDDSEIRRAGPLLYVALGQ